MHPANILTLIVSCFASIFVASLVLSTNIRLVHKDVRQLQSTVAALQTRVAELSAQLDLSSRSPVFTPSPDSTVTLRRRFAATAGVVYRADPNAALPPLAVTVYTGTAAGALFESRAVFSSELLFWVSGEGYVSLSDLYRRLQTLNTGDTSNCADVVCVYGIVSAADCSCTCTDPDAWTGADCSQHTCFGRGTWDNSTEQLGCECEAGYDPLYYCLVPLCQNGGQQTLDGCICPSNASGVFCEVLRPVCDDQCQGRCIDGECRCASFHFGEWCQYNCTPLGIRAGQCFFELQNTGYDTCASADVGAGTGLESGSGVTVCYCGGGFEYARTDELKIKVAACSDSNNAVNCSLSDFNLAECCQPGVDCSVRQTCMSDACCLSQTDVDDCLAMGCTWCEEDARQCVLGSTPCVGEESARLHRASVVWASTIIPCTNSINNVGTSPFEDECSFDTRTTYMNIYSYFLSQAASDQFAALTEQQRLESSREYINSLPWQRRNLQTVSTLGKMFNVQMRARDNATRVAMTAQCGRQTDTGYIGPLETFSDSGAILLGFVCSRATATTFSFRARPPCDVGGGEATLMGFYTSTSRYCISQPLVPRNKLYAYTMARADMDANTALGVSQHAYFSSLVSQKYFCADIAWDEDTDIIALRNTDLVLSLMIDNRHLVWAETTNVDIELVRRYT